MLFVVRTRFPTPTAAELPFDWFESVEGENKKGVKRFPAAPCGSNQPATLWSQNLLASSPAKAALHGAQLAYPKSFWSVQIRARNPIHTACTCAHDFAIGPGHDYRPTPCSRGGDAQFVRGDGDGCILR